MRLEMNKRILLMAAVAMLVAACSKDDDPLGEGTQQGTAQVPVAFGAYVDRATTRAGAVGELTTNGGSGKASLQTEGFGVFAYHTDDKLYSPIYQPNFMYNTRVRASNWSYEPVRYWPNETGTNTGSANVDRLSFFAYAPWVPVTPETGQINTGTGGLNYDPETEADKIEAANNGGIVGLTRNAAVGDPMLTYFVDLDPARQVDFCWGVANGDFTSSVDGLNNQVADGSPFLNVMKPKTGDRISFDFRHALAALNVRLDTSEALDENTKIYIRQITFEGFDLKGMFNLNTDRAVWYDLGGANYLQGDAVTVYDGRTNTREALSANVNETPTGLNPAIIQQYTYDDLELDADDWEAAHPGVTKPVTVGVTGTTVNLFDDTNLTGDADAKKAAPLYVIPTGRPLRVSVVYNVETVAKNLPGILSDGKTSGSSVQSSITRQVTLTGSHGDVLEAGKQYFISLHLGMRGVEVSAQVGAWGSSLEEDDTVLEMVDITLTTDVIPWTEGPSTEGEAKY